MAVKEYAWYWVNYWRGDSFNGQCYDVDDTTNYQVFDPNTSPPSAVISAVDATWLWRAAQSGSILETSYIAGTSTCARINGWQMYQNGSVTCANQGMLFRSILSTFYDGLGFVANSSPNAAIASGPTQTVFWRGTDQNLWEAWYTGGPWNGPANIGFGPLHSAPSVTATSNTQLVFWRGSDLNLHEAWYSGSWLSRNLGYGSMASAPGAATDTAGNQFVWWEDTGGTLQEAWYTASTGIWTSGTPTVAGATLSGMDSAPTAAVFSGTQYVWWMGNDSNLHEAWFSGSWNTTNLGYGALGSAPSAIVDATEQAVFWRGTDDNLWEARYVSGSWGTSPIPTGVGPLNSAPGAAEPTGQEAVWWRGSDQNLWESWFVAPTWNGPANLGDGPIA